jgi:ACS family D-galactonate transporter-like MFS transporter
MSPVAGLVADRINRKWLIVASLFVWSGVTFSMGYMDNFRVLYGLRAVMGISEALYIPAGLSLIADYHRGPTRSLAIGIHMTGLYVGQALGGFGATVADAWSWQSAFHLFGVTGLIYSAILMLLLREYPERKDIHQCHRPLHDDTLTAVFRAWSACFLDYRRCGTVWDRVLYVRCQ